MRQRSRCKLPRHKRVTTRIGNVKELSRSQKKKQSQEKPRSAKAGVKGGETWSSIDELIAEPHTDDGRYVGSQVKRS
jgi:hypothetical protein